MSRINKRYSKEFKYEVVEFLREYGPTATYHKYFSEFKSLYNVKKSMYRWEKIYLEEGIEGLGIERRGRANNKLTGAIKGRRPCFDKKDDEDLIAENQRLRMENDYLKKLAALIQEEEKKQKR